eukprot:14712-Pelagococcus_subviridis.AAC.3
MHVTTSYFPEHSSRPRASNFGATDGAFFPAAISLLKRTSASPTIAEEMSLALTAAPDNASGIASEPVPQPASHTVTPFMSFPAIQPITLSTVF